MSRARPTGEMRSTVINMDNESEAEEQQGLRSPVPLIPRDSSNRDGYMSSSANFSPVFAPNSHRRPIKGIKSYFREHAYHICVVSLLLLLALLGILLFGFSYAWRYGGFSLLDHKFKTVPRERATILHFNDIYELVQINKRGGLSRAVAQRKRFMKANPGNTIVIFAGDLFSPSALSTASYPLSPSQSIDGMQMVNVTNLLFDLAAFGNHEFDLKESALTQRLWESKYQWLATNLESNAFPVSKVHRYLIRRIANINFAFIGICVDTVMPHYVKIKNYTATVETVRPLIHDLRKNRGVEFVVAVTHWDFKQDISFVQEHLGVDLVIGGHNHENQYYQVSNDLIPIAKADANAKSFYVHEVYRKRDPSLIDVNSNFSVKSELLPLTESSPSDPEADRLIDYWWQIAKKSFLQQGFYLERKITRIPDGENWDARNIVVRNGPSDITRIVAESMKYCARQANIHNLTASFFNTGMIRMDDVQGPGDVSTYDILRLLPYPNVMAAIDMNGHTLLRMFEISRQKNPLLGGFMHLSKEFDPICMDKNAPANQNLADSQCTINGKPIELDRYYTFVTNIFLLSGLERNLDILSPSRNPGVRLIKDTKIDFRKCLIRYLVAKDKKSKTS
ncbi:5'-nucleotidase [Perkinsela sp. CCAP 1560/4]|nr:5'-nucleotidase [Perkinsela sp. CCAP 1560/4]|eukprot:KNH06624.1 5'-nucleotidase [Perkinsela sp. CCAP 1560/4]